MSATNRSTKRRTNDWYPTPAWTVHRFLEDLHLPTQKPWYEPCAGTGAIIDAASAHYASYGQKPPVWDASELNFWTYQNLKPRVGELHIGNFLTHTLPQDKYGVMMTNPPYSLALEFIRKCFEAKPDHIVMLLRTSFLESAKRVGFMRTHCPDVYILPDRPHFTDEGSDNCSYGWFHWDPHHPKPYGQLRVLEATPLDERKK